MFENNPICQLFKIKYPIIQAGMVWCSGWKLARAVSDAGGLGIIGAGSMYPEVLETHILKYKNATDKPFAVNLPLLYPDIDKHIELILKHKVPIVFTSAGNPKVWTQKLKEQGIIVVHVISNVKFALKAQEAGVDAIVAEGFEAGGHNGRDEITTLCLIPQVVRAVKIPVIAAGGIATGSAMFAAMALGASAVQIGTRFAASEESSAHDNFKKAIVAAQDDSTVLTLKSITPTRMIKNAFYEKIRTLEQQCASVEEIRAVLGKGRAKKGIFEGDLEEGELEIGQIAGIIDSILPAKTIVEQLISEYIQTQQRMCSNI
ncbi:MAG: nitronate monooxygenase [Bacteroidia bacterium]|nr:nitronate monooxygenase [Bacteroidia bacterium]MDW8303202.1 nitronate monooxygenase [Bacteroidia bacterium]